MGQTVADIVAGERRCLDVRLIIICNSAVHTYYRYIDLGRDPTHQVADGGIPPQGVTANTGEADMSPGGKDLVIPPDVGGCT